MSSISIDEDISDYCLIIAEDATQRTTLSIKNEDALELHRALTMRYGRIEFTPLPAASKKGLLARIKEVLHA